MLNIERSEMGGITLLRLHGDIDDEGRNRLRLMLARCADADRCHIVVNLAGVKYVSYLGVAVLLEWLQHLQAFGGDLKLVGMNLYTERLLRMVGVSKRFAAFQSEAQAIQEYRKAA